MTVVDLKHRHYKPPPETARLLKSLQVGDEVLALALLLDAGEHHLRALDVLGRVDEVGTQDVLRPRDARRLVGSGVCKALRRARRAADKAKEIGALLVDTALLDRVALRTLRLENLCALHIGGERRHE